MSDQKTPTTRDLMKRIDELEQKLAPEPPEDFSERLRREFRSLDEKKTITTPTSAIFPELATKKGA